MACRVWVGMAQSHIAGGRVAVEQGQPNVLDGDIPVLEDGSCCTVIVQRSLSCVATYDSFGLLDSELSSTIGLWVSDR